MIPPNITELFDLTKTEHTELFRNIQYPWEILPKISEYISEHIHAHHNDPSFDRSQVKIHPTASVDVNVLIGAGTIIGPNVIIHGPSIIGKNCELRPGAYVRGNVILGDNTVIGNSTEVKNSVLFNNVHVPHFNYVGDSILGYKAHLGAGAIISNYKSNGSEITINDGTATIKTGLQKFGAILGDSVEVGSNSVLNPGTIIGKNSVIYPLALVRGIVPTNHILKVRQVQEVLEKR